MNHDSVDPKTYFEDIGAWPVGTNHMSMSYVVGFVGAFILTVLPLALIEIHEYSRHTIFSHPFLTGAAFACAFIQFIAQSLFFLHVRGDRTGRDRLVVFLGALAIVAVLISGSLWIMTNLDARMTSDMSQMEHYMEDQNGGI